MKIEIGESLGYSFLRHVKGCWLVQTNWKASETWTPLLDSEALERAFQEMREDFDPDGSVLKGTRNSAQFLRQAEIDVLGVEQSGAIHAMDIAFHEAGLNYVGGPEKRVLKKLLRAKLVLDAYHPAETERHIYFVSPKVHRGVQEPLEQVFGQLRAAFPTVNWYLMSNEKFDRDMLQPTMDRAVTVADSSELFMRSAKLIQLAGAERPYRTARASRNQDGDGNTPEMGHEPSRRNSGNDFQSVVRSLMRTLLETHPTILGEGRLQDLTNPAHCREILDLQLGGFALLRPHDQGREFSGHPRYWSRVYAGRFYVTNNWWPPYKSHNAESLLGFVEKLISEQSDGDAIAALEAHRKALQNYLGGSTRL